MDLCPSMPVGIDTKRVERNTASITVVCRKRPLLDNEIEAGDKDHIMLDANEPNRMTVFEPRKDITGAQIYQNHEYEFDRIYAASHSTETVYLDCVKPLVERFKDRGGKNSIFTYGQTGSGKSYSMLGCPAAIALSETNELIPEDQKGFMNYSIYDIFKESQGDIWLRLSCFEIYNNKVYDLLNERRVLRPLECRSGEVAVHELTFQYCNNPDTVLYEMHNALRTRKTNSNLRNKNSSRGHMICQLEMIKANPAFVDGFRVVVPASHQEKKSDVDVSSHPKSIHGGKFAFIDLAGTERTADSCHISERNTTNGESATINKSLLALKECFRSIDANSNHVPFRDSQLTKVLREYLVPMDACTLMMAHVSPGKTGLEGAINALHYASMVGALRKHCKPLLELDPPPVTESEQVFIAAKDPFILTSNSEVDVKAPPSRKRRGNSSLPTSMTTHRRNSTTQLTEKRRKSLRNSEGCTDDDTKQSRIENFLPTPPRRSSLGPRNWAPVPSSTIKPQTARIVPPTPRVWSSPTPNAPPPEPRKVVPIHCTKPPQPAHEFENMGTSMHDIRRALDKIDIAMNQDGSGHISNLRYIYNKCALDLYQTTTLILKNVEIETDDKDIWVSLLRQALGLEGKIFASLSDHVTNLESEKTVSTPDHEEPYLDASY